MLRWLNGSNSEPQNPKVSVKTPVAKPLTKKPSQWRQNEQGDWRRAGTAGLAGGASLTDTPSDDQLPSDDSSASSPDQLTDQLGQFLRGIEVKIYNLELKLKDFEDAKIDLMAFPEAKSIQYRQSAKASAGKMSAFCKKLFHIVKQYVEPAEDELDELLYETRPHILELENHINSLSDVINAPIDRSNPAHKKSDEEKIQAALEVCDNGIAMVMELKDFLANIKSEIELCVLSERVGEVSLKLMLDFAVFLATSRTIGFNFTFTQSYRNSLNSRIENEKIEEEQFVTDAVGMLKKGLSAVTRLQQHLREDETAANEQTAGADKVKVSDTGMFAVKADSSTRAAPEVKSPAFARA